MHLTLRQLQVFEAVAREGSYTRAAEKLFLTQPAVSMQIRQLEGNVGLPLFEQLGRQAHLTAAGRELLVYSRRITSALAEAGEAIDELRGLRRGRLTLTVVSTASQFATQLLAAFAAQWPDVELRLDVTNLRGVIAQLEENRPDLVITGRPPESLDLEAHAFMDNPLVAVAAPQHPLAAQRGIPLQRLAEERFVLREPGSGTRRSIERYLAESGLSLTAAIELSDHTAVKQAAAAGLGLAIVSLHTLALELASGALVVLDVEGLPLHRQWFVAHLAGKRLSPLADAFKTFLLRDAGAFVLSASSV